ncbi:MAG: hypothetical protein ACXWVF_08835 [Telluria sp.]
MKKKCKARLAALLLAASSGAAAQEAVQLNAALALGAWSSNRVLDERSGVFASSLALSGGVDVSEQVRLKVDGSVYRFGQVAGDSTRTALREAFVQWYGEETEVRLGPQVIAWGRADRINPTDNLTARDYTAPFAVDDAQRIGAPALSVAREFGAAGRLTVIAKRFRASRGPSDRNEAALPLRPSYGDKDEYALRFDHTGQALDWSVSYFNGLEKLRSLQIERAGGRIAGVSRGYAPLEAIGMDAAATAGAWGLRGELARLRYGDTEFAGADGRISHWFGIVGAETSLPGSASASVQYFFRRFDDAPRMAGIGAAEEAVRRQLRIANNQFHKMQDGLTLRYARRLLNDRVDYELVGMVNLRERDVAFRPRVTMRYTDRIKLSAGADVFRGGAESFFGSLKKNTTGFAEVIFIY